MEDTIHHNKSYELNHLKPWHLLYSVVVFVLLGLNRHLPGGWKTLMTAKLYLCKLNIIVGDFLLCRWIRAFTPKCAYFMCVCVREMAAGKDWGNLKLQSMTSKMAVHLLSVNLSFFICFSRPPVTFALLLIHMSLKWQTSMESSIKVQSLPLSIHVNMLEDRLAWLVFLPPPALIIVPKPCFVCGPIKSL